MENNIHKELKEIAPMLAAMDKSNPFKVPDNYFSDLEVRTLDALGKKPVLSQSPPAGYFNGLSDRILEKVAAEEKTKVIPLYKRTWFTIAASFIVIASVMVLMNNPFSTIDSGQSMAFDFEVEEGLDYLAESGDLRLSDLMSLDLEDIDIGEENTDFELIEDSELDDFLNELDQEDLEDLL